MDEFGSFPGKCKYFSVSHMVHINYGVHLVSLISERQGLFARRYHSHRVKLAPHLPLDPRCIIRVVFLPRSPCDAVLLATVNLICKITA